MAYGDYAVYNKKTEEILFKGNWKECQKFKKENNLLDPRSYGVTSA